MQALPSCETITVLGFARFTWNNVLQSYILENFQSFVVFSKIKSVLFLIAFPNCCTGSTWISVTVLSHVSHFPLLIAHTPCFSLCVLCGCWCSRSRASSGASVWFKKSMWCHQGDQNSATLQHGVLPREWECCSSHSQWWQGDDLGAKIQHFWQKCEEQVMGFTFLYFSKW